MTTMYNIMLSTPENGSQVFATYSVREEAESSMAELKRVQPDKAYSVEAHDYAENRVDIQVRVTGYDENRHPIHGVLTGRIDFARIPWPDQQWDEGGNDGNMTGQPIFVDEVLSVMIVPYPEAKHEH